MLEHRWRWLRVPIRIERGENVEYGEDVGNNKTYVSESKVSPGTNPEQVTFSTAWS